MSYPRVPDVLWKNFCADLMRILNTISVTDAQGRELAQDAGIATWHDLADSVRNHSRCLYLIGNGASSSMCSHFAADLNKNAQMRTHVFTDAALLTALGNDISFERIFAEPLLRTAQKGDLLLTISSSGQSPNIIAGIEAARHRQMSVITLSGMKGGNATRSMGDLNIYVPGETYGIVETAHAALLHYWTDMLVQSAQV